MPDITSAFSKLLPSALPRLTTIRSHHSICNFLLPGRPVADVSWERRPNDQIYNDEAWYAITFPRTDIHFGLLSAPVHTLRMDFLYYSTGFKNNLKLRSDFQPATLVLVIVDLATVSTCLLPWTMRELRHILDHS